MDSLNASLSVVLVSCHVEFQFCCVVSVQLYSIFHYYHYKILYCNILNLQMYGDISRLLHFKDSSLSVLIL